MLLLKKSLQCDLKNIALCHQKCFPDSFSTKLGLKYVSKYLEWFLNAENKFLYYVSDDNLIVGYCGGFIPQYKGDGSTSGIMKYALTQAAIGFLSKPWLFLNKDLLDFSSILVRNLFKKVFYKKEKKPSENPEIYFFEKKLGLVVIGVIPGYRKKGIFRMLMNEFEKEAQNRNIKEMNLSVKKNNLSAINAYQNAGWFIGKENKLSLEMYKNIV